ncbi:diacylglycerol/lipid kinase family protein [Aliidiomarina celeris]|uniref:diacylglycerol/lipid kinase family protein n=1 Tax=Aliidiomarina celeris TaxID=2249428 RepID=UPI0013006C4B|nr:YegS/Rv2252/BmrU family lipid kinase [Aliidiomarina celeris]
MARILLLYNPLPNAARKRVLDRLYQRLSKDNVPYISVPTHADLTETKAQVKALQQPIERVIVVGGDGTLHQAVNLFHHSKVVIGYIPAGTGNDFARSWFAQSRRPRRFPNWNRENTCERMITSALYGEPMAIDLGCARVSSQAPRYFINSVGIGFDGELIAQQPLKTLWLPKLSYLLHALHTLFRYRGKMVSAMADGIKFESCNGAPLFMLVVANSRYYGAGMKIAPQAELNDGKLAYICIEECRLVTKLLAISSIYSGRHVTKSMVTSGHLTQLALRTENIAMQIDGEYLGRTPVEINVVPNAVLIAKECGY